MVRNLVSLKVRLTWNGIRSDVQRRFGFPIATILLGILGVWLAASHLEIIGQLGDGTNALDEYLGWVSVLFFLAWITLPVIIFPLDENLDPQQLAVLPISRTDLVRGLAAASLVAPATLVPLAVLFSNGRALSSGWWVAIPASATYLMILAVGSQLFSAAISSILRTRRGRDIATFFVLGIAGAAFFLYRTIADTIEALGLSGAASTHPILDWAFVVPPLAAQRAVIEATAGNTAGGVAFLAAAVAGLYLMAVLFRRLLDWMLTTPEERSRPAARSRRRGLASGAWGPVWTLARKELRFYIRDPRQRLVWTGTVIFVGLGIAGVIMGTTGFLDIRRDDWAPLIAPVLVLFVGLPIALNQFGWERNAASYLFVLPAKPRHLIMGKNAAIATALAIETVLLALGISAYTGQWGWTWLALPLMVAAIGSQLAVGNLISVLTPLRLPREGTDVFAQSTEQGCLAIVSQTVSFFLIGLLLVVPASVTVLAVDFGSPVPGWIAAVVAVGWGVILYVVSTAIASRLLRHRLPEVMEWVKVV
ncbi:MAG: hypothetical protein R3258_02145 [Acidimicrobiia bacterium]|nr:hypothetical protein [Acidimicrobiia bacterium]